MRVFRLINTYIAAISMLLSSISILALHTTRYTSTILWAMVVVFGAIAMAVAIYSLRKRAGNRTILKICIIVPTVIYLYILLSIVIFITTFSVCGVECSAEDYGNLAVKISTWQTAGWWPK